MADSALRRRCRDEQRAPTYREAVRLGLRRPWTPRQVRAAGLALEQIAMPFGAPMAKATDELRCNAAFDHWASSAHPTAQRTMDRLRAWAERVLRETAELEAE